MIFKEGLGILEIEFEDSDTYKEKEIAQKGFLFIRAILMRED